MADEHTRELLLHLAERSITAERLVTELEKVFAVAGGPPKVLRMDNGPELVSQALQRFCKGKIGLSYIPPGTPWNSGYIESFNNRLRKECLNRNHWNTLFEARVVIGYFKTSTTIDTGTRLWATEHRPSKLPDAAIPTTPWTARSTETGQQHLTLIRGLTIRDTPNAIDPQSPFPRYPILCVRFE